MGSFEQYPLEDHRYDLAISGTAFHWIDPNIGYRKVAEVLKPTGTLALFWNRPVQTQVSAEMVQSIQVVYKRVVPEMAERFPGLVHPDAVPTPVKDEIDRSQLFGDATVFKYRWEAEYSAKAYVELLNTYSDHIALEKETRTKTNDLSPPPSAYPGRLAAALLGGAAALQSTILSDMLPKGN